MTVKVGILAREEPEIRFLAENLADEGVTLEYQIFDDNIALNRATFDGSLDANYFQTKPYLDSFNAGKYKDDKSKYLVTVQGVHVEPFGGYSSKYKKLADLPDGATIAIPNEGSNSGRALILLQKAGLIELKDPKNALTTPKDIAKNPHNFKFKELESALLPRVLKEVDLDMINTNYAL